MMCNICTNRKMSSYVVSFFFPFILKKIQWPILFRINEGSFARVDGRGISAEIESRRTGSTLVTATGE